MEGFDLIYVLPPKLPAASNSPPGCCIFIGSNPFSISAKKRHPYRGGASFFHF
jgi:hypothetical protein